MATLLELSQYCRINGIDQSRLLIPYRDTKFTLKLNIKKLVELCKLNRVRHNLQYANMVKDAYGGMMFDTRFNYFKIINTNKF